MELTDGVIALRPLTQDDAEAHLAGEDADQVQWLSGGPATIAGVRQWISSNQQQWAIDEPRRNFAVADVLSGILVGNAEANLRLEELAAGEVNLSYVVFPAWRGRGIAARAVVLICQWLSTLDGCGRAVIRVEPGNAHSHRVPLDAGFTHTGTLAEPDGRLMARYEKHLR